MFFKLHCCRHTDGLVSLGDIRQLPFHVLGEICPVCAAFLSPCIILLINAELNVGYIRSNGVA